MTDHWLQISPDFWNLPGSFKIGGMLDVGTHISLVRRGNGKFVLLDSYTLSDEAGRELDALTNNGADIEAILNLHPFHTIHVKNMHERFPRARLYGTARHLERFPKLRWESLRTEDPDLHKLYAEDFDFSIPRGVDFISANQDVHFSSVMVLHRASGTMHVDDTLMYLRMAPPLGWLGLGDSLRFHITLAKALEKRAGAAADFRAWAQELIEQWGGARNLCAAHVVNLLDQDNPGASMKERMQGALSQVEKILAKHEKKYG